MHFSAIGLLRKTSARIAPSRSATLTLLAFLLFLVAIWQTTSVAPSIPVIEPEDTSDTLKPTIWWHAPFYSGGGYSSEAVGIMLSLWDSPALSRKRLLIAQHGDLFKQPAYDALAPMNLMALKSMEHFPNPSATRGLLIVVCHSVPGAWSVPSGWQSPNKCPPTKLKPGQAVTVGRTMFETDRLTPDHVRRCNAMDEIWVPTESVRQVFATSGVAAHRLRVVPEPVDVDYFNPAGVEPLELPMGQLVFGRVRSEAQPVAFLSIFKWEKRKGWDVLLSAFLTQFTARDNVVLYMKTTSFLSDSNFGGHMQQWASEHLQIPGGIHLDNLPTVYVIDENMPQEKLRSLYASVDCFVLPSRGEGWGRPHVEAMSMALPVIATNWSGPTAFLDEGVGYPLAIDGLEAVEDKGTFEGLKWAAPSVKHLQQLLLHVATDRTEALSKGRAARESMVLRFAPAVVAKQIVAEIERIEQAKSDGIASHM